MLPLTGARVDPGAIAAFALPFLLILYLALRNGGYDVVPRSEVGLALWWLLLVGAAIGALTVSRERAGGTGIAALGLLAAFAIWTATSLLWGQADEGPLLEAGRVATYLAILALTLCSQVAVRWRAVLWGVTAALGTVVLLAALSRMLPDEFPAQVAGRILTGDQLERRLAYPLNYSSGLAALTALAVPLLLFGAADARAIAVRAASSALLPLCALVLWLSGSSLALPYLALGVGAYLLLSVDRLPQLLTLIVAGSGSAVLIAAANARPAIDRGLLTDAAIDQGRELLALTVVVAAGVALIQVAIALAARHGSRPGWLDIAPRRAGLIAAGFAVVALAAFALSPAPGEVSGSWETFKDPVGLDPNDGSRSAQLLDPSSRGRYQLWQASLAAFESKPVTGIGAGGFEAYWARHKDISLFARDGHSLYMETLGELGPLGLLLIGGFVVLVIAVPIRRIAGDREADERTALAGVAAALIVFAAAALVDWVWELGVIGATFAALAGVGLVAGRRRESLPARAPAATAPAPRPSPRRRAGLATAGVIGLLAVFVPMAGAGAVDRSRESDSAGNALAAAADAVAVQPYAATAKLQQALVLERAGATGPALVAARDAVAAGSDDWRNWLTLSRLEARAGNAKASVRAYRRARALNPSSELFQGIAS